MSTLASIIKTAFTRFINSKEKQLHNSNLFFSHPLYPEQGQISHAEASSSFSLTNPLKVRLGERGATWFSVFLHIHAPEMSRLNQTHSEGIQPSLIHLLKRIMTEKEFHKATAKYAVGQVNGAVIHPRKRQQQCVLLRFRNTMI